MQNYVIDCVSKKEEIRKYIEMCSFFAKHIHMHTINQKLMTLFVFSGETEKEWKGWGDETRQSKQEKDDTF